MLEELKRIINFVRSISLLSLSMFGTPSRAYTLWYARVRVSSSVSFISSCQCSRLPQTKTTSVLSASSSASSNHNSEDENNNGDIQDEFESLQQQLTLIEAIETRNEAQLESFVDKEHQWLSMEEEERAFLNSKDALIARTEKLTEELALLWMGQKSTDGCMKTGADE